MDTEKDPKKSKSKTMTIIVVILAIIIAVLLIVIGIIMYRKSSQTCLISKGDLRMADKAAETLASFQKKLQKYGKMPEAEF